MVGFIFGAGTPYKSHSDIMRQREIANALIQQSQQGASAKSIPEGVANLGVGIMAALMGAKAKRDEAKGKASYNDSFKAVTRSLLGGQGPQASGPFKGTVVPTSAPPPGVPEAKATVQPAAFSKPASNPAPKKAMGIIEYANQKAIRNDPLSRELTAALQSFLPDLGVTAKVFSGGQEASGPTRTGSRRHDHGNAADVFFYKDGRRLDWNNPDDLPIFQEIVRRGKAAGLTGFGAGPGYMQPGSMHIGFGTPGIWGAGGRGANAPDWLRTAYAGGGSPMPQVQMASAPVPAARPPMVQMASAAPSSGIGPMGFQAPQMPVQAPPVSQPQIMPASAPPPQAAPAAPAMGNQPMTAYQRTFARSQEREGGNVGPIARGQMARVMGQDPAQAMTPPQGGQPMAGGFFTSMLPAGFPPEQAVTVQQAEASLDGMPIEQIAELASSPYAEDWQKNLMQQYLEYRMKQQFAAPPDPLDQRTKELNIAKLERDLQPEPKARPATVEEKRRLNLPENAPVMVKPDGTVEIIDTSKINPQQSDPTTNMRELAQINQERAARGQPPLLMEDFLRSKRGNGITIGPDGTVQIGGSGMKLTEQQSKDVGFYNRASQIAPILDEIDVNLTQKLSAAGSMVPGVGNFLQSDAYRQARQAAEEFLIALLRKDTGAAVTDGEMSLYGSTYLPRAGDDETTIKQKREARARALEGIRMGLGPAEILIRERELKQSGGSGTPSPNQTGQSEFTQDQIAKAKQVFGLKTDAEAIQRLKKNFEAMPAPPGVDPEDWKFMTPQERALWQN